MSNELIIVEDWILSFSWCKCNDVIKFKNGAEFQSELCICIPLGLLQCMMSSRDTLYAWKKHYINSNLRDGVGWQFKQTSNVDFWVEL